MATRRRTHVARADRARLHARRVRRRPQLGAAVGSGLGDVHSGALRPQPLLLRAHPTRRRSHAHRRRPHQCQRGACRHDDLRPGDANLHPCARHVRRTVVSDRDRIAGWSRPDARRRQHRPGSAGSRPPVLRRLGQLVAVDLQPEDQYLDGSHGRQADVPAVSIHVRPLRRPCRRRRPGQGDAHSRPRDVDVVDRGHEPVRRPQRGHVPARTRS